MRLPSEGRLAIVVLAVFAAIVALSAIDIVSDLQEGTTFHHVALEAFIVLIGLTGALVMAYRVVGLLRRARETELQAEKLGEQLEATLREASRWREEARAFLDGLGEALDRQFTRWKLTPAEKEVALLLIKGLSHKEIADVRSVGEATARQQARAVYRKAGINGRNALAAFFLEDLMLPQDERQ